MASNVLVTMYSPVLLSIICKLKSHTQAIDVGEDEKIRHSEQVRADIMS
jgi:hypothetical protein